MTWLWQPIDVPGGEQTQRLIEQMTPAFSGVDRAQIMRLMDYLERTNPNSPSLARAKAALAAEEERDGKGK